LLFIMPVSC